MDLHGLLQGDLYFSSPFSCPPALPSYLILSNPINPILLFLQTVRTFITFPPFWLEDTVVFGRLLRISFRGNGVKAT
jgi:hypothetical protein